MPNYNYPYTPVPNFQQPIQPTQPTPATQSNGFMVVPNEDIVRNYPVAPGNCVTFKIEGQPIVMEKSMGFSQLEPPRIERYRLVREDVEATAIPPKDELQRIWDAINEIKADIKTTPTRRKKDVDAGNDE